MGLLESQANFRELQRAKNTYNKEDEYVTGHPNALSDGDEKGKGEQDGVIGSSTDIAKRGESATRNIYNRNNEYGINNV
jgi:hypothetical protein